MNTSSSISHQVEVETPRGKFAKIDFESRIDVEIMTLIRCRNFDVDSTFRIDEICMSSPRGFLDVVSTSNQRNFCTR